MDVNSIGKREYCGALHSFVGKSDDVPWQISYLLRSREIHTKDKAETI